MTHSDHSGVKPALHRFELPVWPALLVWWALSLTGLSRQSLWIDEWFTWARARDQWQVLIENVVASERRPPLSYVLFKLWTVIATDHEVMLRVFSVGFMLISIALLYVLSKRVLGRQAALWGCWLMALSPFWLMYGRMIRAYSMTACLALLATLLLLQALGRGRLWWGGYAVAGTALIYTDYSGLAVVAGHGAYVMFSHQSWGWRALMRWGLSAGLIGVSFVPWLAVVAVHIGRDVRITDFATGPLGFVLKLGMPFLSWSAGESIYPLHPLALATMLAAGLFWLWGLRSLWRSVRQTFWLVVFGFFSPILFTATLLTLIATDITFLNAASRSPAAAPFYTMAVAAGIAALKPRLVQAVGVVLLLAGMLVAITNYYRGEQLLNPIYAVPAREVAAALATTATATDLVVAEPDTLIGHYYGQNPGVATVQDVDPAQNMAWIEAHTPPNVFVATFGRDSTGGAYATDELVRWLADDYVLHAEQGYVAVDPAYRTLKARLTGRPSYEYKLTVQHYARR